MDEQEVEQQIFQAMIWSLYEQIEQIDASEEIETEFEVSIDLREKMVQTIAKAATPYLTPREVTISEKVWERIQKELTTMFEITWNDPESTKFVEISNHVDDTIGKLVNNILSMRAYLFIGGFVAEHIVFELRFHACNLENVPISVFGFLVAYGFFHGGKWNEFMIL